MSAFLCYFRVDLRRVDSPSEKSHQIAKIKFEPREKKQGCNGKYNGLICTAAALNFPRVFKTVKRFLKQITGGGDGNGWSLLFNQITKQK
jgi:hypothetical protein